MSTPTHFRSRYGCTHYSTFTAPNLTPVGRALTSAASTECELAGIQALRRLLSMAQRSSEQSEVIARFLLGMYNSDRFPFDLSTFRRLDPDLFLDCLTVMAKDYPNCAESLVLQGGDG